MTNSYFEWKKQDLAKQHKLVDLCKQKEVTSASLTMVLASKYNVSYPCQLTDEQIDDFTVYLESLT